MILEFLTAIGKARSSRANKADGKPADEYKPYELAPGITQQTLWEKPQKPRTMSFIDYLGSSKTQDKSFSGWASNQWGASGVNKIGRALGLWG